MLSLSTPSHEHKLSCACQSLSFFSTLALTLEKDPAPNQQAHCNLCQELFNQVSNAINSESYLAQDTLLPNKADLNSSTSDSSYTISDVPNGTYFTSCHHSCHEHYLNGFLKSCNATLFSLQESVPQKFLKATSNTIEQLANYQASSENKPTTKDNFLFISEINSALDKLSKNNHQEPSMTKKITYHHSLAATPTLKNDEHISFVNAFEPQIHYTHLSLPKSSYKYLDNSALNTIKANQERHYKLLQALQGHYSIPQLYNPNSATLVFDCCQMNFDYQFKKHLYYSAALMQEQLLKGKIDYDYAKSQLFKSNYGYTSVAKKITKSAITSTR